LVCKANAIVVQSRKGAVTVDQKLEDFVVEIAEKQGWACDVLVGILCEILEDCQMTNWTKRAILERAAQDYDHSDFE
jgi:hypothetical protein